MAETLTFWVGNSNTTNNNAFPSPSQRITRINSVAMNLQLNNGGNVSLTIDAAESSATLFAIVRPLVNCILVYRDGYLVWSGPIWTVEESISEGKAKITINAIGWFELLNHRLIRSQPGYSLTTSGITVTNPGFESAISGWTSVNTSTTRSTLVADTGTASLLIAESVTGPFGQTISTQTLAQSSANVFGSTPTAGKRYRLTLRMRARKNSGFLVGNPYAEILEGGVRLGYVDLTAGSSNVSYNTFDSPFAHAPSGAQTYLSVDTTNFQTYIIEWVSTGSAATLRFGQDVNPVQLIEGTCDSHAYWQVYPGNLLQQQTGAFVVTINGRSAGPQIDFWTSGFTGPMDTSKSYQALITYQFNSTPLTGITSVIDSAGSSLGTVDLKVGVTVGSYQAAAVTFTPTANQPLTFWNQYSFTNNGDTTQGMYVSAVAIRETSTDTDNLMNIDNISLQEYTGDGIYSSMDAGQIASALLQKTNNDNNSRIVPGTVQTTQPRTRTYQQFSNVGKEIKALSDIESGYDFVIDPITKSLNIYNRTNATNFPAVAGGGQAGVGTWIYSADRSSSLRFEFGIGADNLSNVKKTQDSSTVVNRLNVKGKYALGFAQDATSQSTNGLFEDLTSLPDVIDASTSVLPFYANAEIAFRKNPKIIYEIQTKSGGAPKLFVDFNIGDRATINIGASIFPSSQTAVISQQIRIFGVQLSVDAEGNERLSGLQLSA